MGTIEKTDPGVEKLLSDALRLRKEARSFLAEKLIESLDFEAGPDLSPAWCEEISRRCKEMDENLAQMDEVEVAFKRIYATLK